MSTPLWLTAVLLAAAVMIIILLIALLRQRRRSLLGQRSEASIMPDNEPPPSVTPAPHSTGGQSIRRLRVADRERTYLLHVPVQLAPPPVPLLLMLHAGFGSAEGFARLTGIERAAEPYGFLVVHPQGYRRSWNAGECCGPAMREGIDDVAFLRAVIADTARTLGVEVRGFAIGFSNGAAMAYRLGCEAATEIGGIVAVGSAMRMPAGSCRPEVAVPVLHLHGQLDGFAPPAGGIGLREQAGVQPALADTIAFWLQHNRSSAAPEVSTRDGITTTRHRDGQAPVTQVTVAGLGHQWPGSSGWRPDIFGPVTAEPSANRLALDFVDNCRRSS